MPASDVPVIPVILCGGSGTRLWPVSRKDFAKQHAPILQGLSPFQETLRRFATTAFARPIVIAGAGGRFMAAEQARAVGVDVEMALEPEGRDTAAAIAVAAQLAALRDPAAVAMVFPSDHLIEDTDALHAAVMAAAAATRPSATPRAPLRKARARRMAENCLPRSACAANSAGTTSSTSTKPKPSP